MDSEINAPPFEPAPRTSGMAIASLVLGILSFLLWILAGIPAIILGIISLVNISNSRGTLSGKGMAVSGIVLGGFTSVLVIPAILVALLLPAVQAAREAARINMSMSQMKQIMLAMHNHHDAKGAFPPAGSAEDAEPPLLSWRVHILPYIEQDHLYQQFHLDESWDSEHNRSLISSMPEIYKCPSLPDEGDGTTVYLAVTGPGAAFQGELTGPTIMDFKDGTSNTMAIVEADPDQAVTWTRPDDWEYDPQNPLHGLGNVRPGAIIVGMGDGSVHRLPNDIDSGEFTRMVTRDAGD